MKQAENVLRTSLSTERKTRPLRPFLVIRFSQLCVGLARTVEYAKCEGEGKDQSPLFLSYENQTDLCNRTTVGSRRTSSPHARPIDC